MIRYSFKITTQSEVLLDTTFESERDLSLERFQEKVEKEHPIYFNDYSALVYVKLNHAMLRDGRMGASTNVFNLGRNFKDYVILEGGKLEEEVSL